MKLPCKVVEDMLPMYYDGICSDESATLIEEHLENCAECSRVLSDLQSEIKIPEKPVDDLKPLEKIQKKWKQSKQAYIKKGICITLAVLLGMTAILTSIWYFRYARYYFQMTNTMERTPEEDRAVTSSDYTLEKDGCRFEVWLPILLSDSGFARVMNDRGLVMFIYPQVGGEYTFWLYVTDESNKSWNVYLRSDMTPDFENHPFPVRTEKQKEHITQLISKRHAEIVDMLDDVETLWDIDLLRFAP